MARKPGRATYEDLLKLPDHVVGEIIDGELLVTPRPSVPHALAGSVLGHHLIGPFQLGSGGPGGWWILDEPELHFAADVVVPDLAGWRKERMPAPPNAPAIELPPDWVCELFSPSTARIDRARKPSLYARVRVPRFWVIDPIARTLEVFRLEGEHYSLIATHADTERVRAEPFDAVELEMSAWWTPSTAAESPNE